MLPPEVLAHIFIIGSSQDDPDSTILPVVISHVCGAWRDLALGTHCLWRRIAFDCNWRISKQYIRRSVACLLDITLLHPRVLDVNAVQWYMHLVSSHIPRWRSFTVRFDHYAPFLWNAALSSCCGTITSVQARHLEELTLVYPKNDDTKEFSLFGGVAPRLTKLTLVGLRLDWMPSLFQNLTFLDYTHHGFTRGYEAVLEMLGMLDTSYQLQELRIAFPHQPRRDDYPHQVPTVTLPHLRRLYIRVRNDIPVELPILLYCLHTPVLQSLHLRDASRSKLPFPSLRPFSKTLRRPQSLELLDVEYGWWEKRFIATFGSITRLVVHGTERWRQN